MLAIFFLKGLKKANLERLFSNITPFTRKISKFTWSIAGTPVSQHFLLLSLCCLLTLEKDKATGTLPKEEKKKRKERVNNKRNERIKPII